MQNSNPNKEIILHRSLGSPYSLKIQSMLSHAELPYKSVIASKGVPRDIQEKLTGAYSRRIPIMQIGADVFCDTDMICSEIASRSGKNYLSSRYLDEKELTFLLEIENVYGKSLLALLSKWQFIKGYFKMIPFNHAITFLIDRAKLAKKINPKTQPSQEENKRLANDFLDKLEAKLDDHLFLNKNNKPSSVDFTAFTHIWYTNQLRNLDLVKNYPRIHDWLARMNQIGSGNFIEIKPEKALVTASSKTPRDIPEQMTKSERVGTSIEFTPNDSLSLINSPIKGVLVGEDEYKLIIQRKTPETGIVHIHIPKKCYGACG